MACIKSPIGQANASIVLKSRRNDPHESTKRLEVIEYLCSSRDPNQLSNEPKVVVVFLTFQRGSLVSLLLQSHTHTHSSSGALE